MDRGLGADTLADKKEGQASSNAVVGGCPVAVVGPLPVTVELGRPTSVHEPGLGGPPVWRLSAVLESPEIFGDAHPDSVATAPLRPPKPLPGLLDRGPFPERSEEEGDRPGRCTRGLDLPGGRDGHKPTHSTHRGG